MHSFAGESGRRYVLKVTLGSVRRLKDELGVDLLGEDSQAFGRLFADLGVTVDAICLFAQTSIQSADHSAETFAEELDGDSLLAAQDALAEALADFFRRAGRTHQAAGLLKAVEVVAATMTAATREVEAVDAADLAEKAISGTASGRSPARPESTGGFARSGS